MLSLSCHFEVIQRSGNGFGTRVILSSQNFRNKYRNVRPYFDSSVKLQHTSSLRDTMVRVNFVTWRCTNEEKKVLSNATWGQFHQRVYAQLLHKQIPKVQTSCLSLLLFLRFLGSAHVKAKCKMLVKLTHGDVQMKKKKFFLTRPWHVICRTLVVQQIDDASREGKTSESF